MRYDYDRRYSGGPRLKRFTYGVLHYKEGFHRYWLLRLPGLYWAWSPNSDDVRWMNLALRWDNAPGYGLIGRLRLGYVETL